MNVQLFRCLYSMETSIKAPATTAANPQTTCTGGWLALEAVNVSITPRKTIIRHGTSHGRPRRKVIPHQSCWTVAW